LRDLLPGIINQLGPDSIASLKKIAETIGTGKKEEGATPDDEDVPELVENFEGASA
jgi:nascent polypeptide-associated complex subunit beta